MRNQQKLFLSDCDDGIINTCVHSTNFPTKTSSLWFLEQNRFPFDLILAILQTKLAKFWRRIKGGWSLRAQSRSFERRICAQTQDLQIFKRFYMSQMNPKQFVLSSTTLHSRSVPLMEFHKKLRLQSLLLVNILSVFLLPQANCKNSICRRVVPYPQKIKTSRRPDYSPQIEDSC